MPYQNQTLSVLAVALRCTGVLLSYWKAGLLLALFFAPITPHLRWDYTYNGDRQHPIYYRCSYVGLNGLVHPNLTPDCPLIVLLGRDSRPFTGWAP